MACGEYDIAKIESTITATALNYWMAFFKLNPFGEDVQDARFQALRADMAYHADSTQYSFGRSMGGKGGTRPKHRNPAAFPIYSRHTGQKVHRRLCDMTPEEINLKMRGVAERL